MSSLVRFLLSLGLIAVVFVAGTVGYVLVEGWSPFRAFYMTVITVATVGYREMGELSRSGMGFTIALILFGVAAVGFAVSSLTAMIVGGEIHQVFKGRKMESAIARLKDHFIFVTLTARQLNPRLLIISRASEPGTEGKLLRAGANRVVSPYQTGGHRMATAALRPSVVDFLDVVMGHGESSLRVEEVSVSPASSLGGARSARRASARGPARSCWASTGRPASTTSRPPA